jgi:hypothetical protein
MYNNIYYYVLLEHFECPHRPSGILVPLNSYMNSDNSEIKARFHSFLWIHRIMNSYSSFHTFMNSYLILIARIPMISYIYDIIHLWIHIIEIIWNWSWCHDIMISETNDITNIWYHELMNSYHRNYLKLTMISYMYDIIYVWYHTYMI